MTTEPDRAKAKFESRGFNANCEGCGQSPVWIVTGERYALLSVDDAGGITPKSNRGLPVFAATCPNCGHVRLFHSDIPS